MSKSMDEMYLKPETLIGKNVFWYYGGEYQNGQPTAGIITKVNSRHVCLTLFPPNERIPKAMDGVRHVLEKCGEHERVEMGGWELREERIDRLEKERQARKQEQPKK